MKNPFLKLIPPVLLFCFGVFCLYNLCFTDWFVEHPIWILLDFHLYIIFISFIVSSIYFYIEIVRNLIQDLYIADILLEYPFENDDIVAKELAKRFSMKEVGNDIIYEFDKKISFGIKLRIFIYFDDYFCLIYLRRSLISCVLGNNILKKMQFVIENEFEKYQDENFEDRNYENSDLDALQNLI